MRSPRRTIFRYTSCTSRRQQSPRDNGGQIFIGSAVSNLVKLTTKLHAGASTPSSAQGVHTIVLVCAQSRPIKPRRPGGCRLDAGPSTSHCNARRCKVDASWQKGPGPACGNGLSGGPGNTHQFGATQCPTILAAVAVRSGVLRAAHESIARCETRHVNIERIILSSCACCCFSAVLTNVSGHRFMS